MFHIEMALPIHPDVLHPGTSTPGDLLPRHQITVMFHLGQHHLVAFPQVVQPPGIGDEIQRFSGILGKTISSQSALMNWATRTCACS